jgi:hypothetical protein
MQVRGGEGCQYDTLITMAIYGWSFNSSLVSNLIPSIHVSVSLCVRVCVCVCVCVCRVGGESGKVHSTVRARWQEQDPVLVSGMKALGDLSDLALQCLRAKDPKGLAALIEQNFALRRALYTDPVVGAGNIQMVDLATSLGFAAKFTGSGGALLLLCKDAQGWYDCHVSVCFSVFHVCLILNTALPFMISLIQNNVLLMFIICKVGREQRGSCECCVPGVRVQVCEDRSRIIRLPSS